MTYYDVVDSLGGVVSWPGSTLREARSVARSEAIKRKRPMKIKNHTTGRVFETVGYGGPRAIRRKNPGGGSDVGTLLLLGALGVGIYFWLQPSAPTSGWNI